MGVGESIRAFSLGVLLILCPLLTPRNAQQASSPNRDLLADERGAPGKLISSGGNSTPAGPLKLLTYKLEEVTLPQPVEVDIRGEKKRFHSVLRLTITSASDLDAHLRIAGSVRRPMIQIEMRTNRPFIARNALLQVQIGKQIFMAGGSGRAAGVFLTPEQFAQLKDGAEVIAFYNSPDRSGALAKEIWYFGRLNKSMLDR
jgi:hypothetical protein